MLNERNDHNFTPGQSIYQTGRDSGTGVTEEFEFVKYVDASDGETFMELTNNFQSQAVNGRQTYYGHPSDVYTGNDGEYYIQDIYEELH